MYKLKEKCSILEALRSKKRQRPNNKPETISQEQSGLATKGRKR
jgi:hypothetical protein